MALVVKDRVQEVSTTTGTGTITLAGAVSGFQSFSAIGDGNTTYYAIVGGTEFEVGIGTYTALGTVLSRDTILESSNGGSAVNFSAGTKNVFVTYPAEKGLYLDASGNAIALGTPASATLTNATGLPISTGVSGLGTGVATFLATPTSANLASAVTDETGSGSLVFATLPTFGSTGIKLSGSTSGDTTIVSGAVAGTTTLTLPTTSGTVLTNGTNTNFPAGSVLQVVSTTKTDTFSSSSSSWNDITGLSVSITPTNSSNKILVIYDLMTGETSNQFPMIRLVRDSTAISIGAASGSRAQVSSVAWGSGSNNTSNMQSMNFLDSPSTTSSTTYKLQTIANASQQVYINRVARDDDASYEPRGVSSITVMEIKG